MSLTVSTATDWGLAIGLTTSLFNLLAGMQLRHNNYKAIMPTERHNKIRDVDSHGHRVWIEANFPHPRCRLRPFYRYPYYVYAMLQLPAMLLGALPGAWLGYGYLLLGNQTAKLNGLVQLPIAGVWALVFVVLAVTGLIGPWCTLGRHPEHAMYQQQLAKGGYPSVAKEWDEANAADARNVHIFGVIGLITPAVIIGAGVLYTLL